MLTATACSVVVSEECSAVLVAVVVAVVDDVSAVVVEVTGSGVGVSVDVLLEQPARVSARAMRTPGISLFTSMSSRGVRARRGSCGW